MKWVDVSVEAASRLHSQSRSSDEMRQNARARVITRARAHRAITVDEGIIHSRAHSTSTRPSSRAIVLVVASRPRARGRATARAETPRHTHA